jgi:hypothetical protein
LIGALLLLIGTTDATACSVCFGDPDAPMTKGMAMGILALGGFITFVLAGILAFCFFLMRRAKTHPLQTTAAAARSTAELSQS